MSDQPAETTFTIRDLEVLEFARAWWKYPGRRDAAILERFGITATRFFSRLNRIIDDHRAQVYDAQLVNQLRDKRAHRARHRRLPH